MIKKLMNKYKSAPKQLNAALWFTICSFVTKGLAFLTTPIFTRLLTTEEYGSYSVFSSWKGILTIFFTLELSAGVYTQLLVKHSEDKKEISSSFQGLTFLLSCAWLVVYLGFADFWNDLLGLTTVQMLAMFIIVWTTAVFHLWAAEQRVELNYRKLVFVTIAVSVSQAVVAVIAVINATDKVTARVLSVASVQLLGYGYFFWYHLKQGGKFFSKKYWLYALSFNLPLVPHYLSQIVLVNADRIMIESMVGSSEAGIYALAYSISNIMMIFNNALLHTMSPWIYQKIKKRQENEIAPIAYGALVGICIANVCLIAFAPEIVRIFAPAEYYDSIWVIPPIALSGFFIFLYSLFAAFEFYYKKTLFIMLASTFSAVLNIVFNAVFISCFGYIAAGYTTLICYIVYAGAHFIAMRKVCKDQMDNAKVYSVRILLLIGLVFCAIGFVFMLTYENTVVRYALVGVVMVAVLLSRKKLVDFAKQILLIRHI